VTEAEEITVTIPGGGVRFAYTDDMSCCLGFGTGPDAVGGGGHDG
jgi:hypothetical protein